MAGRLAFLLILTLFVPPVARATPLHVVAVVPPLAAAEGPDYHLDGPPLTVGDRLLVRRPQQVAGTLVRLPVAVVRVIHVEGGRAVARMERRISHSDTPFLVETTPMVGDEATPLPQDARVEIPGDILFAFDRAVLRPGARAILAPLAAALSGEGGPIDIQGHTDAVGPAAYNQVLSERRAAAVAHFLTAHGVKPERLRVHGYGEREPVADNTSDAGRARNRRVEIHLPLTAAAAP